MGKLFVLGLITAFLWVNAKATVYTVSNTTGNSAKYHTISSAMAAASAGDTIFVLGSSSKYDNVKITKGLTLIGQGHHPANANVFPTTVDYIDIYSDNVAIIGFYVGQNINYAKPYHKSSNVSIERCYVTYSVFVPDSCTNWLVANNFLFYLKGSDSSATSNILVLNNIFFRFSVGGFKGNISIKNNLFLGAGASLGAVSNATISNNIFYGAAGRSASVDYSTLKNNITEEVPGGISSDDSIPNGTNGGTGNFVSKDPGFSGIDATDRYNPFNPSNNYHLKFSSIGHAAGTDGTDIGPFGGSKPLTSYGGDPALPLITGFDINNVVVPQNGTLNISVKAKKQL